MVSRRKRARLRSRVLAGDPQKAWIWGRHVVEETLRTGRWPILDLWVADTLPEERRARYRKQCEELGVPCVEQPPERLTSRVRAADHQGVAARMGPFPYAAWYALSTTLKAKDQAAIVVLDRIQDPYNFGSMIRSAALLGIDAVVIGVAGQVEVTSHVARASAGLVNAIPIGRVPSLPAMLVELSEAGWQTCALVAEAERRLDACRFGRHVALVVGNEGAGIDAEVIAACGEAVRIPQRLAGCLNAAVACGIACYELHRRRSAEPARNGVSP